MTRQTQQRERWEIVETDNRGNPRQMVIHEPEQPPILFDDAAPIVSPLPAMPARSTSHTQGSYQDRARGFAIRTSLLALVTGLSMVVGAYFIGGIAGAVLLAWFFGGFLAVWLASFVLDTLTSAEGSQFLETVFLWQFLKREQLERHRRYGAPTPKSWMTTGDRIFILAIVAWVVLAFVFNELAKNGVLNP